ncbi:MAG: outer membrane lipoprotein LolB [Gammaproteobacteria bacterium]|nr:outer membrane lipoprotein LolB [Gammaproteobacteria bacterium]MBT4607084.1 outer membrane lipoprotein LolB [Thiotrichales bacterium]MBT3472400.1 outer membrane lipoprotein LolB [Gammaproteobacteria bacterium]MBT3968530.1 outer membrane lipoprotein LolB [Gammaproteobacteria bacterium]MBT4079048.1 outer membrane lipoprotein LolB [Gammaproteobacteria bacterium]
MRSSLQRLSIVVAVWLLVGCSMAPPHSTTAALQLDWETRKAQLQQLQQWQVDGRVALRMGKEGGQSGFSWKHKSALQQQFNLSGLLGAGAVELLVGGAGAQLTTAGESYRGDRASQLLFEVTGWKIPVEAAQYWIKGLPDPTLELESLVLDEANRLQQLQQAGWRIEIRRYQQLNQMELPAFVVMEQGDVRLKLRLNRWRLQS